MTTERAGRNGRAIDSEQIEHYIAEGRRLRSKAMGELASTAYRATVRGFTWLGKRLSALLDTTAKTNGNHGNGMPAHK